MDILPSESDPLAQSHFAARQAFIDREKSQHTSFDFRSRLSPIARKACAIVNRIREHEHATLWNRKDAGEENLFPGMIFNSAKVHMEKTLLWKILEKMPKGSLLHCHLAAMGDLGWVLERAIETHGMVISLDRAMETWGSKGEGNVEVKVKIEFSTTLSGNVEPGAQIWSPHYVPGTQYPLAAAAEAFNLDGFQRGKEVFIHWLKQKYTINQTDSISHHLGVDDIWRKFQQSFVFITPIIFYEPITRQFLQNFFRCLVKDNVHWVEMRGMTRGFRLQGEEAGKENRIELVRVIDEEVKKFMASPEGAGFWGVRLIWDCLRSFPRADIITDMHLCLRAKSLFPNLISGFDLVGPEDNGRTLASLTPELLWFRQTCTARNLTIPFFLHAGETTQSGGSTDHNLYDALLLGSRRLGHAISLYKHPLLVEEVRKRNILVECCPISNEVLRYTSSVLTHPLPALLARGVRAALSNDDPGLMGHGGCGQTADFWQCLQGWEDCGLEGLGSLAEDSVRWAAYEDLGDEEWDADVRSGADGDSARASRMREWRVLWEEFCGWVFGEFGEEWGVEEGGVS